MTELNVEDVIRIVRGVLEDKGNPADWYIFDTPENVAKIWKSTPTPVRMNSNAPNELPASPRQTRMPLSYPLPSSAERPAVPEILKPKAE